MFHQIKVLKNPVLNSEQDSNMLSLRFRCIGRKNLFIETRALEITSVVTLLRNDVILYLLLLNSTPSIVHHQ